MKEDKVKEIVKEHFNREGYKVTSEPSIENGLVKLDFFCYKEIQNPQVTLDNNGSNTDHIWIECKGDVNLSEVLEGLIRTAFAVWCEGGRGILTIPKKQYDILKRYKNFLSYDKRVQIMNVEDSMATFVL